MRFSEKEELLLHLRNDLAPNLQGDSFLRTTKEAHKVILPSLDELLVNIVATIVQKVQVGTSCRSRGFLPCRPLISHC